MPVGSDCTKIQELGIDKQENFRAGAIMPACGETGSGFLLCRRLFPITQFVKKLLVPLYGAGDVNLITGTETSPNITQSETFTWANPDNPKQVVVAYNDSRGRNQSDQYLRCVGIHRRWHYFHPSHHGHRSKPLRQYLGDPVVFYNRPNSTWFTVWLVRPAAVRASAGTNPPIHLILLAGLTSALTPAPTTTGILGGWITTHPLLLPTGCTSPITILISEVGPPRHLFQ